MSLKKDLVLSFSCLPDIEGLEKNKLFLTTPLGLISGRFPTDEELENSENINAILVKMCSRVTSEYKSELSLSESESLPGDEGYLYLIDVEIKSPNQTYSIPFMVVFYDQIIGISIGS